MDIHKHFRPKAQKQLLQRSIKKKPHHIQYRETNQYRQLDHLLWNSPQTLQPNLDSHLDMLLTKISGKIESW
jgi:hypothetical protein